MIIKSYKKIILPEQRNPKITQIILNKADSITPSLVLFYFNQQCSSSGNENENPYCKNHEYICARCDFMFVYY